MIDHPTAASVRQRLLNRARQRGEDYNQVLTRYAGLRFLSRLARSAYSELFLLKGATMFLIWNGDMHRPTRDIDLLGFIEADAQTLRQLIQAICDVEDELDGLDFNRDSVTIAPIREDSNYGGLRCVVNANLGSAKLRVQIDVGFGDAITPEPSVVELPNLLSGQPSLYLRAYTPETVIAEKLEAIVKLGLANSRMKDYYDLVVILESQDVDQNMLARAIRSTFQRRRTSLPERIPLGLSEDFALDKTAVARWTAFVRKNNLPGMSLNEVCRKLQISLMACIELAAKPPESSSS